MEHQSILDNNSAVDVAELESCRAFPATLSVSAGIAAVTAHPPRAAATSSTVPPSSVREDHSLLEMACNDLDAALQLLAERAQYITGATGAAIALRRGEHNDMLCRARVGSNAPELGALLSMEYGLSGESVRRRQAMRCDDAESDPRVNREGCRRLGISSVVVMPIVSDDQALGVFELFSGRPQAFNERDLSALQRLSEMIETAVKHAAAAQASFADCAEPPAKGIVPVANAAAGVQVSPLAANGLEATPASAAIEKEEAPKKPLFWSTAMQKRATFEPAEVVAESIAVPPVLRKLHKCQACGFPVSAGRTLCVECEEKQWRGQTLLKPAVAEAPRSSSTQESPDAEVMVLATAAGVGGIETSISSALVPIAASKPSGVVSSSDIELGTSQGVDQNVSDNAGALDNKTLFLNSTLESKPWLSKSWLAANGHILGGVLAVVIILGIIVWLR